MTQKGIVKILKIVKNKPMPQIALSSIKNSKVLVRCGFDIPENLLDYSRIMACKKTIDTLVTNGNKILLLSKWSDKKDLKPLLPIIKLALGLKVDFFDQNESDLNKFEFDKDVYLFNNVHFDVREKSDDPTLRLQIAKEYARLVNYYVDECFISSHRIEATNTEIKTLLPFAYGVNYEQEVLHLNQLKNSIKKPFVLILGGSKLETKLPLLLNLGKKAENILIGGQACQEFYNYENGIKTDIVEKLYEELGQRIVKPIDYIFDENNKIRDIGTKTIDLYKENLAKAQVIFWNGPLGMVENPKFRNGTNSIAKFLATKPEKYIVIGGGDTVANISMSELETFDWVSMGGGASLEFLI
jgi:phosphoglycerate kinase